MSEKLTEHSYDGIQEYDNPLPGWWKNMFWASCVWALFYVVWITLPGTGVQADYDRDMQELYEKQTQELLAMGEIDEVLLATLMKNKGAMKHAEKIFKTKCTLCHKQDGSGDIGPNLTDAHWMTEENTLMAIYTTVRDGRKKMPPWKKKLSVADVLKVAAYVGTIRYTMRDGKAPEGTEMAPAPVPDTRKKKDDAPATEAATP